MKRFVGCLFFLTIFTISPALPTLLIKVPTRERVAQFFKTLDMYYQFLSFKYPYKFLITCDTNDTSMNNETVIKRLENYPNLYFKFSDNSSKYEAINKDIQDFDFDILLIASDDLEPVVRDYDEIIVKTMQERFPDFDGVLNFHDGSVGAECNTLPVIGKKFYERFKYVYNPAYQSFSGNVELTLVSKILKREKVCDQVIIKHNHPGWGKGRWDNLYEKNYRYFTQDKELFEKRRQNNFDLTPADIETVTPKYLSILICTIEERQPLFDRIYDKIQKQIQDLGLQDKVEILTYKDNKEKTIGYKRNILLEQSSGKYVCFLDDDDDVHENYVKILYEKIQNKPDCVSLTGIITTNGNNPTKFIHSLDYKEYFARDGVYYRPPNHLNVIRRDIAIQFRFPEKNFTEDTDWAMQISKSGLLKTQETISEPYYFYLFKEYVSQVGQDKYLNENIFKNKRNGVFVDVGAFDGVTHSNSYYFEKNLGWKGVCIEPLPNQFKKLTENRNCICVNSCVLNDNGSVKFVEVDGAPVMLSGILKSYDPRHFERLNNEIIRDGGNYKIVDVPTKSLNTILRENNIYSVDYLSIDTEGSELEILKSIDFDTFYIKAISVENNFNDPQFRTFLESKGFKYLTRLGNQDDIYINSIF